MTIVCGLFLAVSGFAQSETFSDENVEYTFEIPDPTWKMTVKQSALTPNVEFVYGDKNDGHFEVRKLSIKLGNTLADVIREEETKLLILPGYVAGKEENFKGFYGGTVFNYEFVSSSRNKSGRNYFLKVNDSTVYVLRFTGYRDKLRAIRNQADSIARTFKVK